MTAEADLRELARRLDRWPGGFTRARRCVVLGRPPRGLAPLAAGSAWSACGDLLILTVDDPGAVPGIEAEFAALAAAAERVRAGLGRVPGIAGLLAADPADPQPLAELALWLEGDPAPLAELLDAGLRRAALRIVERGLGVELSVHPSARRSVAELAAELVQAWLPPSAEPLLLLVADERAARELLSPYVRDNRAGLLEWARRAGAELSTPGLERAVVPPRPDDDVLALVAQDLALAHPELATERRAAEAEVGLTVEAAGDLELGLASLARLDAADPFALGGLRRGSLGLILGGSAPLRAAVVREVLERRPVDGLGVVFGVEGREPGPFLPSLLLAEDDAEAIDPAPIRAAIRETPVAVEASGELAADVGEPAAALSMAQRFGRHRVRRGIAAPFLVAAYGSAAPADVVTRRGAIEAARAVLRALTFREGAPGERASSRKVMKFRA